MRQSPLKSLFSSAVRADVLSLLLNSPDEMFYVREAAKLLRKNPSAVSRELSSLEKAGLLKSFRVANLKYYQADQNHQLFPELKSLITKSLGFPGALKALLRSAETTAAFIYGPYAEGLETKEVNIFLLDAENITAKNLRGVASKFGFRITGIWMSSDEFKAKRREKDPALKSILSQKRINLVGRIS